VITFSTELTAKRVEILKELVPGLSRVALLHNMGSRSRQRLGAGHVAALHKGRSPLLRGDCSR
jgi:hypothetical protein